ncbi:MAG: SHOCT domain-containing protein [Actinomycetota bacterium]
MVPRLAVLNEYQGSGQKELITVWDRYPRQMPHHDAWGGPDTLWVVLMVVLIAAFVGVLVWMVANARSKSRPASAAVLPPPPPPALRSDGALEHARMRYARGEISREEFLQVVQDLGGPAAP